MIKHWLKQLQIGTSKVESIGSKSFLQSILVIASFCVTTLILLDIERASMVFFLFGLLLAFFITQQGYLSFSSWLIVFMALGLVGYLMLSKFGVLHPIIPAMLAILVATGLLIGRKGILIVGGICLFLIGLTANLSQNGYMLGKPGQSAILPDYLTALIFVIVGMSLEWLIITHITQILNKANQKIGELEQTQALLVDAENRYQTLIEKMPIVVYIAEPGVSGPWHYVSPHVETITGYSPSEWTGNPDFWYSIVHPDDRDRVLDEERVVLSIGMLLKTEYRLLTKAGHYIWVYDESLLTVTGSKNQAVHGYILDITARKEAEAQLSQRLNELETMREVSLVLSAENNHENLIEQTGEYIKETFKASNAFIAIHNTKTNMIHFPFDIDSGVRIPDVPIRYGRGVTSRIMEMKKPLVINENWLEESMKYGTIYRANKLPKSSIAVPMMIQDRAIGVISIDNIEREHAFTENDVRLLTTIASNLAVAIENNNLQESVKQELKIQQILIQELEKKNEELERFTYTASHDLKAPLITIRGYLGYIEKDSRSGNYERLMHDINRISEATEKMNHLLSDLLELSRVGRIANKAEEIRLNEIAEDALERVKGIIEEKNVNIKIQKDLPTVLVDKERIVEVIQNLVDNAIKFMGNQPNPQIEIGSEQQNNETIYFVKDNGIGIRKEFHEKIFGLFDKLDSESEGTGIGLALVKRIIEVHDGKIWVKSEEGKGSTFYFTLSKTP